MKNTILYKQPGEGKVHEKVKIFFTPVRHTHLAPRIYSSGGQFFINGLTTATSRKGARDAQASEPPL